MKIAVLVSGGVDSSVALRLLKQQGHELVAFYLKIWLEDELSYLGSCPWQDDLSYVQQVCAQAEVPLKVVNLQQEYHDHVVSYTINELKEGRTPNPDVQCNSVIKFGFFLEYLKNSGEHFDKIATGHYAQVMVRDGQYLLRRAPDAVKDQTYFLARLSQEQLSKCLFPIGHLTKPEVRALAQQFDLPNKDRKDSQGICFLGKIKFNDFIKHHLSERPGDLIEYETGAVVGQHKGFWFYTIGQRQGIGLAGGPWYCVAKDTQTNRVYISRAYYAQDKKRDTFDVVNCHWFASAIEHAAGLHVKIRHGQQLHACTVTVHGDTVRVTLAERDQGIAAGQLAVVYADDVCVGAGFIQDSL